MSGPLRGIRVVEVASIVLGPMAGQYLGDMGADVIKVESPEGDLTRSQGPRRSEKMSAFFLACNRNKRSVVLDLNAAEGREVLHKLVQSADVFLHSIRTPAAAKLGFSYQDLAKLNPKLIYCHVKGFSDQGVYAGRPAYDDIIQAMSGIASLQSVLTGEPRYVPAIVADKISSVHAAYAIALALFHRAQTGLGQEVVVPMFETTVSFNLIEHLWGAVFDPPIGEMGYPAIVKGMRRPFKTQDGYLALMPHTDGHWLRFFVCIGRPEMMEVPIFSSFQARQQNFLPVWKYVEEELAKRTTSEWLQILDGQDIPFAAVTDLNGLLDDPHLDSVNFWEHHDHPTEGSLRMPGVPFELSQSPGEIRRLAPNLGEHTAEIMRELGYDKTAVDTIMKRERGTLSTGNTAG